MGFVAIICNTYFPSYGPFKNALFFKFFCVCGWLIYWLGVICVAIQKCFPLLFIFYWRIVDLQCLLRVKMKLAQSCLTLCDPMGYTVHGILQARIREWVAIPFSRGSFQPRDSTQVSHIADGFFTS